MTAEIVDTREEANRFRVRIGGVEHCFPDSWSAESFCESCRYEFKYVNEFTQPLK